MIFSVAFLNSDSTSARHRQSGKLSADAMVSLWAPRLSTPQ